MDSKGDASAEIEVIRCEIESAADAMLSAASHGMALVARARLGESSALDELEATFCAILEACAFQDLTGQRLSRLKGYSIQVAYSEDALLQGPARSGLGLNQEAADRIFDAGGAG